MINKWIHHKQINKYTFMILTTKRSIRGLAKLSRTNLISVHSSLDLNSWRYLENEIQSTTLKTHFVHCILSEYSITPVKINTNCCAEFEYILTDIIWRKQRVSSKSVSFFCWKFNQSPSLMDSCQRQTHLIITLL